MITIKHKGEFKQTSKFFVDCLNPNYMNIIERYANAGVNALASATPVDSSNTANSWGYDIKKRGKTITITWYNTNVVDGVPIVILLQYGHGTSNGGYVQGRDFINPTLKPLFDKMANDVWKEVTK